MARFIVTLAVYIVVALAASPLTIETRRALTTHLTNIHLSYNEVVDGIVTFTYGSCVADTQTDAHHLIGRSDNQRASRLVWVIPQNTYTEGCVSAWSESGLLLGRSIPQQLQRVRRRALEKRSAGSIAMTNSSGIDASGPWFDGVELLNQKEPKPVDVAAAKSKDIAIVGAGMPGLMTYLVLHQAGMTNVSIIEAGQRLGGRVHTAYLSGGPFDYSYQEMGPMRFPETYTDKKTNETVDISDQKLVFSLAREMNKLNGHDKNLSVDFIPWIQSNPNGLVYNNGFKLPNGLPPTVKQISENSSLGSSQTLDPATEALSEKVDSFMPGSNFSIDMAKNMFKAHKQWLEAGLGGLGGDDWSEFAFMVNYMNGTLKSADLLGSSASNTFWNSLYEGLYFSAATWKTIDGG